VYPIEGDESFLCACGQTVSLSGVVIPEYSQKESFPTWGAKWHLQTGPELKAAKAVCNQKVPAIAIEVIVAHEPVSLHHLYFYNDASLRDAVVGIQFSVAG
jgi:hypothetical protein